MLSETIGVPPYHELMGPVLRALSALGGSGSNEELLNKIIDLENYPDSVVSLIHSDNRQTKLNYNIAWAKTYLKRIGAVENSSRGIWSITDAGRRLTADDLRKVPSQVRRQDYDKRRLQGTEEGDAGELTEEIVEATWKDALLGRMQTLSPASFERLAQRVLREAGFTKVEVTGRSGDGGIDGVGVLRLNLLSFQTLFQCKRYQGSVGASAVRDFRGAMVGRSDKGLIITTGTFTADARREATRDGAPAIDLIDGDQLCDLLKSLKIGVSTEMVERVSVDEAWFDQLARSG